MYEIGVLADIISSIGVIIAIMYYAMVIRNQNRTFRAQLFMQTYSRFNDNQFWENNFEMRKKLDLWEAEAVLESGYLTLDTQSLAQFNALATFFEGIGVLVKRGLIDITLVNDLMLFSIIDNWEVMVPVIERLRELSDNKNQYKPLFSMPYVPGNFSSGKWHFPVCPGGLRATARNQPYTHGCRIFLTSTPLAEGCAPSRPAGDAWNEKGPGDKPTALPLMEPLPGPATA